MAAATLIERSLAVLGCYAIGCVATGWYLVRLRRGGDLRDLGSGSVGATNVGRVAGRTAAVVTALADIGKGALALALARFVGLEGGWLVAAAAAVAAGHVWPAQLRFRGGRGVAPTWGAFLVLDWRVALFGLAFLLLFLAVTRRRALTAVVTYTVAPLFAIALERPWTSVATGGLYALLIVFTHRRKLRENACATADDSSSRSPPTRVNSRRSTA